jgi:hypothetical protein
MNIYAIAFSDSQTIELIDTSIHSKFIISYSFTALWILLILVDN